MCAPPVPYLFFLVQWACAIQTDGIGEEQNSMRKGDEVSWPRVGEGREGIRGGLGWGRACEVRRKLETFQGSVDCNGKSGKDGSYAGVLMLCWGLGAPTCREHMSQREVLSLQHMIPPKRFDIFSP